MIRNQRAKADKELRRAKVDKELRRQIIKAKLIPMPKEIREAILIKLYRRRIELGTDKNGAEVPETK